MYIIDIYLSIDNDTGVLTLQSDLNSTMQFDLIIKVTLWLCLSFILVF